MNVAALYRENGDVHVAGILGSDEVEQIRPRFEIEAA